MRVALVSSSEFVLDPYEEDIVLLDAFASANVAAELVDWRSEEADWGSFDLAIVRSAWNYHKYFAEFERWLSLTEPKVTILNPPSLIRWNWYKGYLLELEARGVPIVPTLLFKQGAPAVVPPGPAAEIVIKPAISASAHGTEVFAAGDECAIAHLEGLLATGDALIQPLQAEIRTEGETSLIYIAGEFTHAVQKRPKAGDYRVQWEYGGTSALTTATERQLDVGSQVIGALPMQPLYARVDLVDIESPRLMEVELIEPELFLYIDAGAAKRLVVCGLWSVVCGGR